MFCTCTWFSSFWLYCTWVGHYISGLGADCLISLLCTTHLPSISLSDPALVSWECNQQPRRPAHPLWDGQRLNLLLMFSSGSSWLGFTALEFFSSVCLIGHPFNLVVKILWKGELCKHAKHTYMCRGIDGIATGWHTKTVVITQHTDHY